LAEIVSNRRFRRFKRRSTGGKDLPPFQLAIGLQQWWQERFGWRQAGRQLPLVETTVSLSLPPFEAVVGAIFSFFLFGFYLYVFSQYYKCEITGN
jgi:hypothetical protein